MSVTERYTMRTNGRDSGFTLTEVLIAVVIMSVLGGGLVAIMRRYGRCR